MTPTAYGGEAASDWIRRWSHLVAPGGTVLDVACGRGRHVRWFAARGHRIVGIDRSQDALAGLSDLTGSTSQPRVGTVCADIESGPWPLVEDGAIKTFAAVVVTNYLWRALFPTILRSVADGGVLLYETFAHGNAAVGKPSRPDFLLQPGELLHVCQGLRVIAYEDGFCADPPRFVQRIAAVRVPGFEDAPIADANPLRRYPL